MVPTLEKIGIEKKPTVEASKPVVEVLEWQWLYQCTYKRMATVHLEEAWTKIGKYALIDRTASTRRHFEELDFTESTVHK